MKVTTINGEEVFKKDARKIKREDGAFGYYKIGNPEIKDSGDCYQINNLFYAVDKKRITWDYFLKRYVLKTGTVEGIIDKNFTIGSFSSPDQIFTVVYREHGKAEYCLSDEIARTLDYIEGDNRKFYNPKVFSYRQIYPRRNVDQSYKQSLNYNFKDYMTQAKKDFSNYKIVEDPDIENFFKLAPTLFNKYSFGIELETTRGLIPEHVYKSLGIMPVRDGSISGLEYVTIPLGGKKGLYAFRDIVNALIKYTDFDYTCSMHVHIGGVPRTMEFIVAMFKFAYYFQNHLYQLFPGYKRIHDGTKRQCYTGPLDSLLMSELNFKSTDTEKIKDDFQRIVFALSGKYPTFAKFVDLEDIEGHPSDPNQNSKWHMKERYKWLNLIPLIFTNKQTVEYRIFTVPDTVEKALVFLLTSLLITDAVESNTAAILNKPSFMKNVDLMSLTDYSHVSGAFRYSLIDRLQKAIYHSNNKGAFFEESELKIQERFIGNFSRKDEAVNSAEDNPLNLNYASLRRALENEARNPLGRTNSTNPFAIRYETFAADNADTDQEGRALQSRRRGQ